MPAAPSAPLVSIVIPVRGDSGPLTRLLTQLPPHPEVQIVVSATGSPDAEQRLLQTARNDIRWVEGAPGRGVQLNGVGAHREARNSGPTARGPSVGVRS